MVVLDVLIVGGGLSGMVLAQRLSLATASSKQWKLLEARSVLGGRLINDRVHNEIDLGGAWIWPDQKKIAKLIQLLASTSNSTSIETFQQPDDPSSTRIVGGAVQLVNQLAAQVPPNTIQLNSPVVSCTLKKETATSQMEMGNQKAQGEFVEIKTANQETYQAKRVVFAVPPKLLTKHVKFDPPLNPDKWRAMSASETWMAGVTKVALEYPKQFWDSSFSNMGLPQVPGGGPAFQVYDSSTKDAEIVALTFFTLVPSNSPAYKDDKILAQMVAQQMATVWKAMRQGSLADQAQSYTNFHVHRWPMEKYISEDEKPVGINPHPSPMPHLASNEWGGKLLFAGSEADLTSPGVMEGAVGAAERVLKSLEPLFASDSVGQCT